MAALESSRLHSTPTRYVQSNSQLCGMRSTAYTLTRTHSLELRLHWIEVRVVAPLFRSLGRSISLLCGWHTTMPMLPGPCPFPRVAASAVLGATASPASTSAALCCVTCPCASDPTRSLWHRGCVIAEVRCESHATDPHTLFCAFDAFGNADAAPSVA